MNKEEKKIYMKEYMKKYQQTKKYKESQKKRMKKYQQTEQFKKYQREYMKKYRLRDYRIKYNKKYKQENKERLKEYNTIYSREYQRKNRRWTQKSWTNDKTITKASLQKLYEYQNKKCKLCWINLEWLKQKLDNWKEKDWKHLDHILPLVRWGIHSIFNVQWLCRECNLSKQTKIMNPQLSIFNLGT